MLVLRLCALPFAACTSAQEAREREDRIREAWVELEVFGANEQIASTEADCPDHSDAGDGDAITGERGTFTYTTKVPLNERGSAFRAQGPVDRLVARRDDAPEVIELIKRR